jgi:DNA-binding MarR family transcriptional regulator
MSAPGGSEPQVTARIRVRGNGRNYLMTDAMQAVLAAVVDAPETTPAWGLSICESTGLRSGTVYPALDRLMKAGLIRDEWEVGMTVDGRRRRFYHRSFDRSWYRANRLLKPGPAS